LLLTAGAILIITLLVERVDSSRRAQLASSSLALTVRDLEAAPFSADREFNPGADARSPHLAQIVIGEIRADEAKLSTGLLLASAPGAPAGLVAAGRFDLAQVQPAVVRVYELAAKPGGLVEAGAAKVAAAQTGLERRLSGLSTVLDQLGRADAASAQHARERGEWGTTIAMLLLLVVFGYFYFRAERLSRENTELLALSREEASTDALTGLGNRRALIDDLSGAVARQAPGAHELLVAIFDLDGFKHYNDTFGHVAGDALLSRLGGRLSAAIVGSGTTYRMGGDEFCMLAWCAPDSAEALLDRALTALSDSGEGWHVSCSQGAVWMPSEAATSTEALRCADLRMYAGKTSRAGTGRQIADVLLQVLKEQDKGGNVHGGYVAELSGDVAVALHQSDLEVQRIRLAATLHDVGKTALPKSLLNKEGPLNVQESEFMHGHTLIGERIVLAAPALASTAPLIRSSHERPDGRGYPDGLRGKDIPVGSLIIAACDGFDAMTSARSYRKAASVEVALEELRRCAGSQFDREVVDALCEVVTAKGTHAAPPSAGVVS
jgi:diguanylate cyclase (GGDEF)-like protein